MLSDSDSSDDELETENTEDASGIEETNSDTERPMQKGGQPSIVSKFPEIVDQVSEFIKQHGFSAQNRCRTEIVYSNGVTAKKIQEHIYKLYPALKQHKISLTTIRRMFTAPNKHFRAAERYKSLMKARVAEHVQRIPF